MKLNFINPKGGNEISYTVSTAAVLCSYIRGKPLVANEMHKTILYAQCILQFYFTCNGTFDLHILKCDLTEICSFLVVFTQVIS